MAADSYGDALQFVLMAPLSGALPHRALDNGADDQPAAADHLSRLGALVIGDLAAIDRFPRLGHGSQSHFATSVWVRLAASFGEFGVRRTDETAWYERLRRAQDRLRTPAVLGARVGVEGHLCSSVSGRPCVLPLAVRVGLRLRSLQVSFSIPQCIR